MTNTIAELKQDFAVAQVKVQVIFEKEKGFDGYLIYCPELNIYSQGDTKKHAEEMIREAIELYLESYYAERISNE